MMSPDAPMIDTVIAEPKVWKEGDMQRKGMRLKDSRKPHGVVRIIDTRVGSLFEGTFNKGNVNGLYREFYPEKVGVYLYQDGTELAKIDFMFKTKEIKRKDPKNYLLEMYPEDYEI